jgi:hypothetical protein
LAELAWIGASRGWHWAPGPAEITVETPDVTVKSGEVKVDVAPIVPDYLLWTIVGIGALLIIALIVLIVRTRRVA